MPKSPSTLPALFPLRNSISRNRNNTARHPFGVCRTTKGGTVKSVLALLSSVIVAYTNDGYLRDAYR
jgi:hypothetical protein